MTHKITLIPGDGIGPEVTQAVLRILEATGVKFEWERYAAGAEAFEIYGEYIPGALYESIERNKVALKGPVTTPIGGGFKSINVTLRKKFELFANFRPIKNLLRHYPVKKRVIRGLANVTGGGLVDNVARILPDGKRAVIRRGSWPVPPVFDWLKKLGDVPQAERGARAKIDDRFGNVIGRPHAVHLPHGDALVRRVDEPAPR